jgi:hypothetical protein
MIHVVDFSVMILCSLLDGSNVSEKYTAQSKNWPISALKMEEVLFTETLAHIYHAIRCHNSEDYNYYILLVHYTIQVRSRDSDWLPAGQRRGRSSTPGKIKKFLFSTSSRPALGSTQTPFQWVPGALSPRVKRPVREAGHSPSISDEVKKMWIYTSIPPYVFMA